MAEVERLDARKRLTASENELSGIIFERVGDQKSFGRIRSKGDAASFGLGIMEKLSVLKVRPVRIYSGS